MRMEHSDICILKLIKKTNISETNGPIKFKLCMLPILEIYNSVSQAMARGPPVILQTKTDRKNKIYCVSHYS